MDVEAVSAGFAAAGLLVPGLNTAPSIPDAITPPCFAPTELELSYQQTFGRPGLTETLFSCGIFTSRGDSPTGRALLAGYLSPNGPTSIRVAIETDRTLGGTCSALIVERVRGAYRLYEVGSAYYLGAIFEIRVWA